MSELDFFRRPAPHYNPMTPHAALRAYEEGILPIEHFIHMSTSLHPLDEANFDISAIERVLARDDLGLDENLFLMNILELMVRSKDAEYAVFAAESINLIEARYNHRIERLKDIYVAGNDPDIAGEIARAYYELARINEKRKSIKLFYLKEGLLYLKDIIKAKAIKREEIVLLIRILLDLELYQYARDFLKTLDNSTDPIVPILRAEVDFSVRDWESAFEKVRALDPDTLGEYEVDLYTYWLSPYEK
jgi:hypothetical protein